MISTRTSRELAMVIQNYVGKDKSLEFINKMKEITGTNRTFKIVLDEIYIQTRKLTDKPSSQTPQNNPPSDDIAA